VMWLERECRRLAVEVRTGDAFTHASPADGVVIQCTGSVAGDRSYQIIDGAHVVDVADLYRPAPAGTDTDTDNGQSPVDRLPAGTIAVFDPIGGPIAVALAEQLGDRAVLITQDQIAGNELSRSGDLAPANVRLAQRGVQIERRSLLRSVSPDQVEVEDRFTGQRRTIACTALVDCGFRLPSDPLPGAQLAAGDAVAPRTLHEAVLEGRRAALAVDHVER
jgi:hypothetical protein